MLPTLSPALLEFPIAASPLRLWRHGLWSSVEAMAYGLICGGTSGLGSV